MREGRQGVAAKTAIARSLRDAASSSAAFGSPALSARAWPGPCVVETFGNFFSAVLSDFNALRGK
jgi:hypothetical protein